MLKTLKYLNLAQQIEKCIFKNFVTHFPIIPGRVFSEKLNFSNMENLQNSTHQKDKLL